MPSAKSCLPAAIIHKEGCFSGDTVSWVMSLIGLDAMYFEFIVKPKAGTGSHRSENPLNQQRLFQIPE
jgi:hypothetical protein